MARDIAGCMGIAEGVGEAPQGAGPGRSPRAPSPPALPPGARFNLARRFALAGALVMLVAMLALGTWVSTRIERGVVRNTAAATALYMESFVAPLAQELGRADRLPPKVAAALAAAFADTALGERVVSYKLWKRTRSAENGPEAEIVHASDPALIGARFPLTEELAAAFGGRVSAAFDELGDPEDVAEQAIGLPLLEIYAPVHARLSGDIIAVAEFYERAEALESELRAARWNTWLVVVAVMLGMAAALFGIVGRGSQIIARQGRALDAQLRDLAGLAARNEVLGRRIRRASSRAAELNERYLRRLSAELHDGPAQLLGFALLRLGGSAGAEGADAECPDAEDRAILREALERALAEVRNICRGLALPDLAAVPLEDAVRALVKSHRELTGTGVELSTTLPVGFDVAQPAKICVCRFVQEGLANATRHAGGRGQRVRIALDGTALVAEVADDGSGFVGRAPGTGRADRGLGLAGLRERVESLGGTFSIGPAPGGGARIAMRLDFEEGGNDDGHE